MQQSNRFASFSLIHCRLHILLSSTPVSYYPTIHRNLTVLSFLKLQIVDVEVWRSDFRRLLKSPLRFIFISHWTASMDFPLIMTKSSLSEGFIQQLRKTSDGWFFQIIIFPQKPLSEYQKMPEGASTAIDY